MQPNSSARPISALTLTTQRENKPSLYRLNQMLQLILQSLQNHRYIFHTGSSNILALSACVIPEKRLSTTKLQLLSCSSSCARLQLPHKKAEPNFSSTQMLQPESQTWLLNTYADTVEFFRILISL